MAKHRDSTPMKQFFTAACFVAAFCAASITSIAAEKSGDLQPLKYGDPELVVDLGVGLWAWPAPMDFDGDGDMDLVVACPDKPYRGLYYFENPGNEVFLPAVRLGNTSSNVCVSYVGDQVELLTPGKRHPQFKTEGIGKGEPLAFKGSLVDKSQRTRANQWKLVDYDGDGLTDLIVGLGTWGDYGWDNAYDQEGTWTNGPLHGRVHLLRNVGTESKPEYAEPQLLEADGNPIDVYGMPSPSLADFDGDGDLDLVCGDFIDRLTYFENTGTRNEPSYAAGRDLLTEGDQEIRMELCMIVPTAVDWDGDGDVDLVVGQEDGRVAVVENTGRVVQGQPRWLPPRFLQQQADEVKVGALVTPYSVDWDNDGDEDLICGDTAGYVNLVENLDDGNPPRWAPPVRLKADGETIRIEAGPNGSIQGPCETKWGYTVPCVADWNHDGLLDIMINSIWGEVLWYRNVGKPGHPELAAAAHVDVDWPSAPPKPAWNWWSPQGKQLVTQWRTSPVIHDLDGDGLNDLVMLDHEGYLVFFQRKKEGDRLVLAAPQRIFQDDQGEPLLLNDRIAGGSGRRKLAFMDWDADGKLDLIVNSKPNVDWLRNVGEDGTWVFKDEGPLAKRELAGHTTCPTTVDWDHDGERELLIGAEDGRLYYFAE